MSFQNLLKVDGGLLWNGCFKERLSQVSDRIMFHTRGSAIFNITGILGPELYITTHLEHECTYVSSGAWLTTLPKHVHRHSNKLNCDMHHSTCLAQLTRLQHLLSGW